MNVLHEFLFTFSCLMMRLSQPWNSLQMNTMFWNTCESDNNNKSNATKNEKRPNKNEKISRLCDCSSHRANNKNECSLCSHHIFDNSISFFFLHVIFITYILASNISSVWNSHGAYSSTDFGSKKERFQFKWHVKFEFWDFARSNALSMM